MDNFVIDGEQAIIKEWILYVTGLFAAFAVSVGLNQIIQEQWEHDLISFSGSVSAQDMTSVNL